MRLRFRTIAGCVPDRIRIRIGQDVWDYFDTESSHITEATPNKKKFRVLMGDGKQSLTATTGVTKAAARANFWELCVRQKSLEMGKRHPICQAESFDTVMNAIIDGRLP